MPPPTPEPARRRRALAAAGALGVAAVVAVVVALAGGGGEKPPATGAARLVPADALAYLHFSTDRGRAGVKRALDVVGRFPSYPTIRDRLFRRLSAPSRGVSFESDVAPWLGREAALALLNTRGTTAGALIVLDVSDRGRARAFLQRAAGPSAGTTYRGVRISGYGNGASAFVEHYLVIGPPAAVRRAVDDAAGRAPSLAADATFRRATSGLPAGRAVDAYASAAGVRRLLEGQGGVLGALGALLDRPGLRATGLALTAKRDGLGVEVRSLAGPGAAPPSPFEPALTGTVPKGAMAYLGLTRLDRIAGRLLAAGTAGGITAARLAALLRRAGRDIAKRAGVDLQRQVLPLFRGEVALWLTSAVPQPALSIVAKTSDEAGTRAAFARLQGPLARLFAPPRAGPGQAPVFAERDAGGVAAYSLRLAPGVELDYAVFDGKLVLSTSLAGIRQTRKGKGSVEDASGFGTTLGNRPKRVTSLLFLDFRQLLRLGERTGLAQSPAYLAVRQDLERVRAIGAATSAHGGETTTEVFFQIS